MIRDSESLSEFGYAPQFEFLEQVDDARFNARFAGEYIDDGWFESYLGLEESVRSSTRVC